MNGVYVICFYFLDCTVEGRAGNGTTKGTCDEDRLCHLDGICRKRKYYFDRKSHNIFY